MIRRQLNFMVRLKNIERNSNIIECDIIPEDSIESGHVSVQIDSKKIENFSLPNGYEWCRNHVEHARMALLKLVQEDNIPNEKLIMWN